MNYKLLTLLVLSVVLLLTGCSGLKIKNEEPAIDPSTFTGQYRTEGVRYNPNTKSIQKFEGEVKILNINGKLYVSGSEHSIDNPSEIYKFTGKGIFDEKTKTISFLFIVNGSEEFQGEYTKKDFGFEWVPEKNNKSSQSYDKWIKLTD